MTSYSEEGFGLREVAGATIAIGNRVDFVVGPHQKGKKNASAVKIRPLGENANPQPAKKAAPRPDRPQRQGGSIRPLCLWASASNAKNLLFL